MNMASSPIRKYILGALAFSCLAVAQDPQNGGWRRLGDSNPYPPNSAPPNVNAEQGPPPQDFQRAPQAPIPPALTIRPGTYVTVRVNQPISSDHNQVGDAFSATLVKPVVVDGVVVAERGQTVGGSVSGSEESGHGVRRVSARHSIDRSAHRGRTADSDANAINQP